MPSISPLATYWPSRPTSTTVLLQLALALAVVAVFPQHPLAVLHDVLRGERDDVLAVVVEGDLADDRVAVLHFRELVDHAFPVRSDLFDHIHEQARGGKGERTVRLRPLVVALRGVLAGEEVTAGKLLGRCALDEGEAAFGELRSQALDVRVGLDAGGALEHRLQAEAVH